jgi:hypothetical protein
MSHDVTDAIFGCLPVRRLWPKACCCQTMVRFGKVNLRLMPVVIDSACMVCACCARASSMALIVGRSTALSPQVVTF